VSRLYFSYSIFNYRIRAMSVKGSISIGTFIITYYSYSYYVRGKKKGHIMEIDNPGFRNTIL